MDPHAFAFILAGGSGERFWPMSRSATPKHLLRILSDETLLAATVARLEGAVPRENIFVLTNVAQAESARKELPGLPPENILAEPAKRDTAPACALAAAAALAKDPLAVCALLPADAAISPTEVFREQLEAAFLAASRRDAIVTFGMPPTYPATGFGYLHLGEPLGGDLFRVRRFVEKPDLETARAYLASGEYAWNGGIFVWRAAWFRDECARLAPVLADFIGGFPKEDAGAYIANLFPGLPKISVDYAILEKTPEVVAVKARFAWDDVGSWTALPAHLGADSDGNTVRGGVTLVDSRNSIAVSTGRHIAVCGVDDIVVVETPDAVLVCHRDAVQDIKKLHPNLPEHLL